MLECVQRGPSPHKQLKQHCPLRIICRDLKQPHGASLHITNDRGGYRWGRPEGWSVPVDPSMVLAPAVVEDLLKPLQGTVSPKPSQGIKERPGSMLTPEGDAFLGELNGAVHATTLRTSSYEAKMIEITQGTIGRQHVLWMRYAKPTRARGRASTRLGRDDSPVPSPDPADPRALQGWNPGGDGGCRAARDRGLDRLLQRLDPPSGSIGVDRVGGGDLSGRTMTAVRSTNPVTSRVMTPDDNCST